MTVKQIATDLFARVCGTSRKPHPWHPMWLFIREYQRVAAAQKRFVAGRVLDIGSGDRFFERFFGDRVERYVGLDYPAARVLHGGERLSRPDIEGDGRDLPFVSRSFDTVFLFEVLEHCSSPCRILDEAFRVLEPGGHVLISVPFASPEHSQPHDYYRYSQFGLRHMLQGVGFTTIHVTPIGSVGAIIAYYFNYSTFVGTFSASTSVGRVIKLLTVPLLIATWLTVNLLGLVLDRLRFKEGFVLNYYVVARRDAGTEHSPPGQHLTVGAVVTGP